MGFGEPAYEKHTLAMRGFVKTGLPGGPGCTGPEPRFSLQQCFSEGRAAFDPDPFSPLGGNLMRNLLALLACGVLVFGVVGWYLDWYTISTTKTADGDRSVTIEFDKDKIIKDVEKKAKQGEEKLVDKLEKDVKSEVDKQLDNAKNEAAKKLN